MPYFKIYKQKLNNTFSYCGDVARIINPSIYCKIMTFYGGNRILKNSVI